jgi:hypothetical protein
LAPSEYGAFVLDPNGHNIEAVCHIPGWLTSECPVPAPSKEHRPIRAVIASRERDMTNDNARDVDRAWELIKKIGFAIGDPNIRVLKITPDDAEFRDTPGSVISYASMAAAAVTGWRPEIDDNRKVAP